jgi:hypothetical protein
MQQYGSNNLQVRAAQHHTLQNTLQLIDIAGVSIDNVLMLMCCYTLCSHYAVGIVDTEREQLLKRDIMDCCVECSNAFNRDISSSDSNSG